ncbi:hypothetical protein J6590_027125 [Homalodisca vitripennis]|nr:hypothetical protein J6590_027125 [Homalodisca vitripennis]
MSQMDLQLPLIVHHATIDRTTSSVKLLFNRGEESRFARPIRESTFHLWVKEVSTGGRTTCCTTRLPVALMGPVPTVGLRKPVQFSVRLAIIRCVVHTLPRARSVLPPLLSCRPLARSHFQTSCITEDVPPKHFSAVLVTCPRDRRPFQFVKGNCCSRWHVTTTLIETF